MNPNLNASKKNIDAEGTNPTSIPSPAFRKYSHHIKRDLNKIPIPSGCNFYKMSLTLPKGLMKKLNQRIKLGNEVSLQELIRKLLEKQLNQGDSS